jgi:hypothetical protein
MTHSLSSAAVRTVVTTGDKSKSDALGGAPQSATQRQSRPMKAMRRIALSRHRIVTVPFDDRYRVAIPKRLANST